MDYSKQFIMRDRIIGAVSSVLQGRDYLNRVVNDMSLSALEFRVVTGIIEKKFVLEEIMNRFMKKKAPSKLYHHLLASVYMTLFMDRSSGTTIDISTEYAKWKYSKSAGALTYALSKNAAGIYKDILDRIKPEDLLRRLYIHYSLPETLAKMFLAEHSMDFIEDFLSTDRKVWFRAVRVNINDVISVLSQRGIEFSVSSEVPEAFSSNHQTSAILSLFPVDAVIIQDLSSQILVSRILQACRTAGIRMESFLDGCSSPGGKAIGLVPHFERSHLNDSANVRLKVLSERIHRIFPEKNITFSELDLTVGRIDAKFDLILLDVPCSGLWVLNRKQDIRLNYDPENARQLTEIQKKILANTFHFAKNNSIIVYSTCTFNREENDGIVEEFLSHHGGVTLLDKGIIKPAGSSGIFFSILVRTE